MDGTVCYKPEEIGKISFQVLYDVANGKKPHKAEFITYPTPGVSKAEMSNASASGDENGTMTTASQPDEPMLRLEGIQKTFPNGTVALRGVDFVAQAGRVRGLLGANGAGSRP